MKSEEITTITIPVSLKDKLEKLKIHRREPYYEVIRRLLKEEVKE